MQKNIALIYGDCSSPEIVTQAVRVLDKVAEKFGHTFTYTRAYMGGEAIDKFGDPLPQSELDKCLASDSVLLGAVGGPKWEGMAGDKRPEKGLLRLRAGMGLYANNRPARIWPQLADASPLKKEIVDKGIDFIVVRELIGGVYFGEHKTIEQNGEKVAIDSMPYSEHEIERIGRIGFETAMKRRKKLTCVDKANVLDTSRLWRAVMHRLQAEYPEVEYSEMFVDNCAMQICKNPSQFDVIVTENMFGDILSDEASEITGSIGMVPSSSLGATTCGLYEPIHGSAPDIAGQDVVNPIACILSAAMMLRYSFGMAAEADAIESAVNAVLNAGLRTADMMDMTKAVQLEIRGAQQTTNTEGDIEFRPMRVVVRGRGGKLTTGKVKAGSSMDTKITLTTLYILIEVDGKTVVELDKLNEVYKVNGVDVLAKIKEMC